MVLTLTRDEARAALLQALEAKYPSFVERLRALTTQIFVESHAQPPNDEEAFVKAFTK